MVFIGVVDLLVVVYKRVCIGVDGIGKGLEVKFVYCFVVNVGGKSFVDVEFIIVSFVDLVEVFCGYISVVEL